MKNMGRDVKPDGMPRVLQAGTTTYSSNNKFMNSSGTEFRQASVNCDCGPVGKRAEFKVETAGGK
jgi:hypothetical protein